MNLNEIIKKRINEFELLGEKGHVAFDFRPFYNIKIKATVVSELAFCISTANSSALSGLKFQKLIEDKNLERFETKDLEFLLKKSGVRFYKRKAEYICSVVTNFDHVERALRKDDFSARKDLLKIKGLGFKESSHFLRNVGRKNLAIIDRHVLRWLGVDCHLSPKSYISIEESLRKIAENRGITLAELDLFIWFDMTGKILK
uniref:N-glycosylase/DNA lyase n=1 Tax=Geoglobus ahangari TaxID=113653 RepID=A0A7C4S530_9EURY